MGPDLTRYYCLLAYHCFSWFRFLFLLCLGSLFFPLSFLLLPSLCFRARFITSWPTTVFIVRVRVGWCRRVAVIPKTAMSNQVSVGYQKDNGRQCRFWWNDLLWAILSGFSLSRSPRDSLKYMYFQDILSPLFHSILSPVVRFPC